MFAGRCIPDLWRCDGRPDCEDHRDEYSCTDSCGNDEYLCPTEKWCIPQTWRCNGVSECAAGEDEKLCDCALDQFKCQTGGCIAKEQVCDGVEHCPDRSDEWNCLADNMTVVRKETVLEDRENSELTGQVTLLKIRYLSIFATSLLLLLRGCSLKIRRKLSNENLPLINPLRPMSRPVDIAKK